MASSTHAPVPAETVSLGPGGGVRLPERLRDRLGWREGDKLVWTVDGAGHLKILTVRDAVRSVRGTLSPQAEGAPPGGRVDRGATARRGT